MVKKFLTGQIVRVQRSPSAPWEPAEYIGRVTDWTGYHKVLLPLGAERRIDSMSGEECGTDNPRGYITRALFVPTRRLA